MPAAQPAIATSSPGSQAVGPPAATHAVCKNCGAALTGAFCVNCGQRADVHVLSTRELLHEALEGITHSDSRLWRSLRLLWFKPGQLTLEFIAGRRESYLPPFRLYLVLSVILFLLASFIKPTDTGNILHIDAKDVAAGADPASACDNIKIMSFGGENAAWQKRLRHGCVTTVHDQGESMMHVVLSTLPKAMFVFLPLIALLHMLVYWWPRHRYAIHLLFFVHLHAFFFSAIAAILIGKGVATEWPRATGFSEGFGTLMGWTMAVYTVLAIKRVFARGWFNTLCKALGLFFVYVTVFSLTLAAVFIYAFMQV
jgi:hypothetical protein